MIWRGRFAAVLLVVVLAGEARAQTASTVKVGDGHPAQLKDLVKRGGSASARGEWDQAVEDFRAALKIAPDDARVHEKLRRALDRRAQAREALAARPPPPPSGMSDGAQENGLAPIFENLRWQTRLKREALEARAEAEAARPSPDEKKLAKLRRDAAGLKAEEDHLTTEIADAQKKEAASKAEDDKVFGGVQSAGLGGPKGR
jgi:tetratricopeptide (TPR) repeat protein